MQRRVICEGLVDRTSTTMAMPNPFGTRWRRHARRLHARRPCRARSRPLPYRHSGVVPGSEVFDSVSRRQREAIAGLDTQQQLLHPSRPAIGKGAERSAAHDLTGTDSRHSTLARAPASVRSDVLRTRAACSPSSWMTGISDVAFGDLEHAQDDVVRVGDRRRAAVHVRLFESGRACRCLRIEIRQPGHVEPERRACPRHVEECRFGVFHVCNVEFADERGAPVPIGLHGFEPYLDAVVQAIAPPGPPAMTSRVSRAPKNIFGTRFGFYRVHRRHCGRPRPASEAAAHADQISRPRMTARRQTVAERAAYCPCLPHGPRRSRASQAATATPAAPIGGRLRRASAERGNGEPPPHLRPRSSLSRAGCRSATARHSLTPRVPAAPAIKRDLNRSCAEGDAVSNGLAGEATPCGYVVAYRGRSTDPELCGVWRPACYWHGRVRGPAPDHRSRCDRHHQGNLAVQPRVRVDVSPVPRKLGVGA